MISVLKHAIAIAMIFFTLAAMAHFECAFSDYLLFGIFVRLSYLGGLQ